MATQRRSITDWIAWTSPGVLIVVGAALFVIPLPPTSMIGIGLILLGVAMWVVEYVGGRRDRAAVPPRETTAEESEE